MITRVLIEGVGEFAVKADMTHRSRRYLKLHETGNLKEIQFNSLNKFDTDYQDGYDNTGADIKIKILEQS